MNFSSFDCKDENAVEQMENQHKNTIAHIIRNEGAFYRFNQRKTTLIIQCTVLLKRILTTNLWSTKYFYCFEKLFNARNINGKPKMFITLKLVQIDRLHA